jgi:RNA polymerase sigma factor (sigma-70 family)
MLNMKPMAMMQHSSPREDSDDEALMRRIAARDGEAFALLVDRHAALPHRVAWRMLGDGTEAEDVAQEALLRLWQSADSWRGDGPGVAAWLRRVATNLCLDRLRKRARISGEAVPERADEAPLADALIEEEDERSLVIRALGNLPERQRAAVVLTYYEELSNADAARLLEMNIKAFESLLLRARRALRDMLVEPDND